MTVLVIGFDDGRIDYAIPSMRSLREMVTGERMEFLIHEDSGNPRDAEVLRTEFPDATVVATPGRSGFGGAIRNAWRVATENYGHCAQVFHAELDYIYNREVPLDGMAWVLDTHRYLTQLALRRQPWNDMERAAGGVIERWPGDFVEIHDGYWWLEHRRWFTTNPCLYRAELMDAGWPEGAQSEGRFSLELFEMGFDGIPGPEVRSGYWGTWDSGVAVEHIGVTRAGTGY